MLKINIPKSAEIALPSIAVGRGSALTADFVGIARDYSDLQIHIGLTTGYTYTPVSCASVPGGDWRAYLAGMYFPTAGKAYYHLTAKTSQGDSIYLGKGRLTILDSVLNASSTTPTIPEDTYVRNPSTGLWHLITGSVVDGEFQIEVSQTGITR